AGAAGRSASCAYRCGETRAKRAVVATTPARICITSVLLISHSVLRAGFSQFLLHASEERTQPPACRMQWPGLGARVRAGNGRPDTRSGMLPVRSDPDHLVRR